MIDEESMSQSYQLIQSFFNFLKESCSTASNVSHQIKRFGGLTRPNERFRQSFQENLVEDEEDDESDSSSKNASPSPKHISPEKQRTTGARPKK